MPKTYEHMGGRELTAQDCPSVLLFLFPALSCIIFLDNIFLGRVFLFGLFAQAAEGAVKALFDRRSAALGLLGKHIDSKTGVWTEAESSIG